VLAHNASVSATTERVIVQSRELAAEADTLVGKQRDLALLLSVEAERSADTDQARSSLLETLLYDPRLRSSTVVQGSPAGVGQVAFSPDGTLLAASQLDGTLRLWDVVRRRTLARIITVRHGWLQTVAFSPNGRLLALGGCAVQQGAYPVCGTGYLGLWDVPHRNFVALPWHGDATAVTSVAFSPAGTLLAAANGDGTILLWDVRQRRPLVGPPSGLPGGLFTATSVAFSPDGKTLAFGGCTSSPLEGACDNGGFQLWSIARRQFLGPLWQRQAGEWVSSIALSPNGALLAAGQGDGSIDVWDMAHMRLLGPPLRGTVAAVQSLAFSHDGKSLASGGLDHTIRLWDVARLQPLGPPLTGHTGPISGLSFSRTGATLASGSGDGTIRLWDFSGAPPLGYRLTDPTVAAMTADTGDKFTDIIYSPGGPLFVSVSFSGGAIQSWSSAGRHRLGQLPSNGLIGEGTTRAMALSPDGTMLAFGSAGGAIQLWDAVHGRPLGSPFQKSTRMITALAFCADNRVLAAGDFNGVIQLWDVVHRRPLGQPLRSNAGFVRQIVFNATGTQLAASYADLGNAGAGDTVIWRWDVQHGQAIGGGQYTGTGTLFAFSPDGTGLIYGAMDNDLYLWTGAQTRSRAFSGHTAQVLGVAVSPDGRTLASGSRDGTIRLWDLRSAQSVVLAGPSDPVTGLLFSPDGGRLISHSCGLLAPNAVCVAGGTVWVWDLSVASWIERACHIANRNLTLGEWQQYLPSLPYQKTCPGLP
jgi:WD40 repeat protein